MRDSLNSFLLRHRRFIAVIGSPLLTLLIIVPAWQISSAGEVIGHTAGLVWKYTVLACAAWMLVYSVPRVARRAWKGQLDPQLRLRTRSQA